MSLAIVHSRAQVGVEAPCVSVEAHLANGLPSLTLVGLPETAVRESKDRVRSALLNAGFDFPARRITSTSPPPTYPRTAVASTWPSHSASSPPAASCPAPPSTAWSASANWPCPGRSGQCEAYCRPRWRRATQGAFWWYRRKMPKRPAWPAG